jgi:site-specific recombinase XerD
MPPTSTRASSLHELRHTAASLAIRAGANIKALQNMLGHESAG